MVPISVFPFFAYRIARGEICDFGAVGPAAIDLTPSGSVRLEIDPLAVRTERRVVGVLAEGHDLLEIQPVFADAVDSAFDRCRLHAARNVMGRILALPGLHGEDQLSRSRRRGLLASGRRIAHRKSIEDKKEPAHYACPQGFAQDIS